MVSSPFISFVSKKTRKNVDIFLLKFLKMCTSLKSYFMWNKCSHFNISLWLKKHLTKLSLLCSRQKNKQLIIAWNGRILKVYIFIVQLYLFKEIYHVNIFFFFLLMLCIALLWASYSSWRHQYMVSLKYGRVYLHGCTFVQRNIGSW